MYVALQIGHNPPRAVDLGIEGRYLPRPDCGIE